MTDRQRLRAEAGFFVLGVAMMGSTFGVEISFPNALRLFCLIGGFLVAVCAAASWADRSNGPLSDRSIRNMPGFFHPPTSGPTVHTKRTAPTQRVALIRPARPYIPIDRDVA